MGRNVSGVDLNGLRKINKSSMMISNRTICVTPVDVGFNIIGSTFQPFGEFIDSYEMVTLL